MSGGAEGGEGTPIDELPPLPRVKEPREEEEPPGAPEWVVTFTDMISLLVTFFVLLMTFSSMEEYELLDVRGLLPGNTGMIEHMNGPTDVKPPENDLLANTDPLNGGERAHERPEDQLDKHTDGGTAQADDQTPIDLNKIGDGLMVTWDANYSFGPGSVEINPKLEQALIELSEVLRFYPHQIVLEGHAAKDHRPTREYPDAETISLARAMSAAQVLIDHGVEEERIQVTGHGAERPRSVANTAESRQANRRVELRVLTLGHARSEQLKHEWRERRNREGGL
ncbi:OmpA/MotB family protein [Engelhardtia mirabilis]|uniref:Putative lipoprotein YiaD n=1 Tax=Engelhardtia mirabilis TaxID=2528011 RepID=A0A518BST5_9BACT|nr:putative lipoprotein YiaD precursor [Planctomycetes bacterium Pla133]QDV04358.1 putative lipoprotein YiaD precursor [Planctomycetes bacterium Pla86]